MPSENQQSSKITASKSANPRGCRHVFKPVPGGRKCRKCPAFIPGTRRDT